MTNPIIAAFEAAEINPKDLPALHRQLNKTLFLAWINADLENRAHNDLDRSIMLFDADQDFTFATRVEMDEEMWDMLVTSTPIKYWSRGL